MANTTTRRDLEEAIVKKALKDEAFRGALISNPRSALQSALEETSPGTKLPANMEVKAIQEPPNAFYVVLPHVAAGELSDADLENVAGGTVKVSAEWSR
jgi:hypothetical protein